MENYADENVASCLDWFLSFMSPAEWIARKSRVEHKIDQAILIGFGLAKASKGSVPISDYDDKICWYMYMMHNCLNDANKYDPVQGARVLPIFKTLGEHIKTLKLIEGVNKKVRRLIKKDPKDADPVLFELLTALLWARNGYQVSFIAENKISKQPDLRASKNDSEWFIECKRFSRASDYTAREKEKWLKMMSYINRFLVENDMVLDVLIHVELHTLPDDFLYETLIEKLKSFVVPGIVIDNKILKVEVSFVDYVKMHKHLEKYSVRLPSPQLNELIAGKRDENKGFTSATIATPFRLGEGIGSNIFVNKVEKAYGVFWSCDSPEAIDAKARDVKQFVSNALKQLPQTHNSVIHIGIETYDGPEVERSRFQKINKSMNEIGIEGLHLDWVFCHFFQSYAPPDQMWVFDESLIRFNNVLTASEEPLKHTSLIIPWDLTEEDNLHWFKPQP